MNDKEQTHFEDRQVLEKEETTQLIQQIMSIMKLTSIQQWSRNKLSTIW